MKIQKLLDVLMPVFVLVIVLPAFLDVYSKLGEAGIRPEDVSVYVKDQGYSKIGFVFAVVGISGILLHNHFQKMHSGLFWLSSIATSMFVSGMALVFMDRFVISIAYVRRIVELMVGGS